MNILAFCCALNKTYLALEYNGKIISKVLESDNNYHSLYLIQQIKTVFKDNNFSFDKLDMIGVNLGPGSFTGIRVAVVIAKVMAGELNIPVVGLDTTNVLLNAFNYDVLLMDARRDMYYVGTKEETKLIYKDKFNDVIKEFKDKKILADKKLSTLIENSLCYEDVNKDIGLTILELAKEKYLNTKDKSMFDCIKVNANYIQTPPVFN